MVTGNQIEFGGDIAQRSVLVGLDPKCERPDLRSGFVIEDLEAWLDVDENRVEVIRALLILARGWISDGGHAEPYVMRGFTRWATAMGGFLLHYGLGGFLSNRDALEKQDDEAVTWSSFLSTWFAKYGRKPIAAAALLKSAEIPWGFSDPWDGTFITRQDGKLPSARGLGKMLAHHAGRFYGEYRLERWQDKHSKMFSYAPVPKDEVLQAVLGEGQPVG
jgi:hypothetical protein